MENPETLGRYKPVILAEVEVIVSRDAESFYPHNTICFET